MDIIREQFFQRVEQHLHTIYQGIELPMPVAELAEELITLILSNNPLRDPTPHTNRWDEQDIILIAYGDSIINHEDSELAHLPHHRFPLWR